MTTPIINNDPVVLTSISQVMQIFPEPALDEFEIEDPKIQGYILTESDILRGLVNYAYQSYPRNDIVIDLSLYVDAISFADFVWNPDGNGTSTANPIMMSSGADFLFDNATKNVYLQPSFQLNAINAWNIFIDPLLYVPTIISANVPFEFTVIGGFFNGQRKRALAYDTGTFNDASQAYFLQHLTSIDPFIQRMCAILVVLDIIKYWIKPLYMADNNANIAGTVFTDVDKLPGWDHMQKRLETAFDQMMAAIRKWGLKDGRVGDGHGMNPEDPSILRTAIVATAVRGNKTSSPTQYSPYMGWDDVFVFERPDRTSALGDTMFGYQGRLSSW